MVYVYRDTQTQTDRGTLFTVALDEARPDLLSSGHWTQISPTADAAAIAAVAKLDQQRAASIAQSRLLADAAAAAYSGRAAEIGRGQPGGVASLDSTGKVPTGQLPATATVAAATSTTAGVIKLAGALTGTAASPSLTDGSVTGSTVSQGALDNSHLAAGAGIAQTKIAGLALSLAGKADLGVDGKVHPDQIPAIGVVEYLGAAADQAAMLAKSGQAGDWTARLDTGTVWIIKGGSADPSQMSGWQELAYPAAADATTGTKGAVRLAGDLAGTAGTPVIAPGAVGTSKLADGAVTGAKVAPHADIAATAIAGTALTAGANLGDVGNVQMARANLGLAGAAQLDVGTGAGTVAAGDDTRLTGPRVPTTHAASHAQGGSDPVAVTPAQVTGLAAALNGKADLGVDGKVASSQLPAVNIPDLGIGTAKLDDLSVTTGKLAAGAVTDAKVADVAMGKVTGLAGALAAKAAKGESYLSIADYGPLGTADDRATIQAALDAAAIYGARVFVPPGSYTVGVNATTRMCLYLKPGVKGVFGAGEMLSTIRVKDGQGDYHSIMSTFSSAAGYGAVQGAANGLEIHDLTLDQNNAGNHVTNVAISGPLFAGGKPRVCLGIGAATGGQVFVRNVRCIDTDGVWTVYFQGRDFTMENCEFVVSDTATDHDHSALYTSVSIANGIVNVANNIIAANTAGNIGARTAIETHGGAQNVTGNTVRNYQKAGNLTGVMNFSGEGINWTGNRFLNVKFGIQLWSLETASYHAVLSGVNITYNHFILDPVSWTPTGGTYCCAVFLDVSGNNTSATGYNLPINDVNIEGNVIRYLPGHVGIAGEHVNNAIEWRRTYAPTVPGSQDASTVGQVHDRNIRIVNNYIEGAGANGIRYSSVAGDYVDGLVITGNRIRNCGQFTIAAGGQLSNSYGNAIMVAGTLRNSRIEDNEVIDDQATHTTNNGLYLTVAPGMSAGANNVVRNNRVNGVNAPAYVFSTTIDGGYLLEADLPTWVAPAGIVALASTVRALDTGVMYRQTGNPVGNPGSTWVSYTPGGSTGTPAVVDTFTGTGTWTKRAGATVVEVIALGGSGAAGSGRRGAAGSVRCGGGAGAGGGYARHSFAAAALTGTVTVTIGAAGVGGAAVTTNDTSGNPGTAGGATTFGGYLKAAGGTGGLGGGTSSGTGGAGGVGTSMGGAGASASTNGGVGLAPGGAAGGPGGGSGGGLTTGNVAGAGGGSVSSWASGVGGTGGGGGTVDTTAPTAGGSVTAGLTLPGGGGGGGAASRTTDAQAGGNGGSYGGGGGGGGASENTGGAAPNLGGNSGKGGDGTPGICQVITYF